MASFDEFRDVLEAGLRELVDELVDHKDAMLVATELFLKESEDDLKKWTRQVANGEMSPEDLKFLVKGKADLAMVHWHTQVGISKVAVDKFRSALLNLITDTTIKVFL